MHLKCLNLTVPARLALVRAETERDHARELAAAERVHLERAVDETRAALEREQARADRLETRLALPWWRRLLGS
jgi:hypothetical protein